MAQHYGVSYLDNAQIVEILLGMALAVEFLEDNPFKAKAYRKAAQSISELDIPVEALIDNDKISQVEGVGQAIEAHLKAWVKDHDFSVLEHLRAQIPPGLIEMWKVQGLGIKKLRMLSRELGISTLDELLIALNQGRLSGVKGFSEKTIGKLKSSVQAVLQYRGWYLLDAAWDWVRKVSPPLEEAGLRVEVTGVCRRMVETIDTVDLLVQDANGVEDKIRQCLGSIEEMQIRHEGSIYIGKHPQGPTIKITIAPESSFIPALFVTTGSHAHVDQVKRIAARHSIRIGMEGIVRGSQPIFIGEEVEVYRMLGLPYLPPEVREGRNIETSRTMGDILPKLVSMDDLIGTIHIHTTYSDGKATLKDMVMGARERGHEWIGISDHSRSAYYAGGLNGKDLARQFKEIDCLIDAPGGITILKGIEADILPDGSLDYPPEVLKQFDFVIASIHSHMDMDRASMTDRIIKALLNPYTSILGHPTGRVLLTRQQYEVDMEAVLTVAAGNSVAVELNANPMRLDIDWRLIPGFVSIGGRIIIGPDAHTVAGLDDVIYGVAIARKGLLTRDACLNTLDASCIKEVLTSRWK